MLSYAPCLLWHEREYAGLAYLGGQAIQLLGVAQALCGILGICRQACASCQALWHCLLVNAPTDSAVHAWMGVQ
jgi:hypothetical protein